MSIRELYQSKVVTVEEALSKIRSHDVIAIGAYSSEPEVLLSQLHSIAGRVEDVKVWTMNTNQVYPYITDESLKGKIDCISNFYGAGPRQAHLQHRCSYVPTFLSMSANSVISGNYRPTVYMAAATPPDEHGFVRTSCSQLMEQECLEAADLVIFEINPQIPVVNGTQHVPISKIDYIVELDYPPCTLGTIPITDVERKIGENAASLVEDGDTIQLGIGGIPNAVGEALMSKKDLGIHTEMLTGTMGKLMDAGVVTNEKKTINRGKTIGAFAWGDEQLYHCLNNNPMVEIRPSRYVNDPFVIAQHDNMVSINTVLQIDLTGQVCSESIGTRQFSGTGGAFDFAYGAFRSKGGRGILAFPSTAKKGTVSKIQPVLAQGSQVSIPRNVVDYVVTEYGIAKLRDRSVGERVEALISIAHPDFREELKKQAEELKIW